MAGNHLSYLSLIAAFMLVPSAPVAGALLQAPQIGQAAIFVNPSLSRSEQINILANADANLVRFGGAPGFLVVELTHTDSAAQLRAAGAWLVADPIILGGCSQTEP